MDVEVMMLKRRIKRLETLVGQQRAHDGGKLQLQLRAMSDGLRAHVPDEMAAAQRALALLSVTKGGAPHGDVRRACDVVDAVTPLLCAVRAGDFGHDGGGGVPHCAPRVPAETEQMRGMVAARVGALGDMVREEEGRVDELLQAFDGATARLNGVLLALAHHIRELSASASTPSPPGGGGAEGEEGDGAL